MSHTSTKGPNVSRRRVAFAGPVGRFVTQCVEELLATSARPATVATLARLRANIGRAPGVDATIWDVTMAGAPGKPQDDSPTAEESAIHAALTLFALHQRGTAIPMHRRGLAFGQAIRQLNDRVGSGGDGPGPVRRRFNALVTATSFAELSYHLRSPVEQLRRFEIAFDYGLFADDLFFFQLPGRTNDVRRAWARQYYRQPTSPTTTQSDSPSSNSEDQNA